MDADFLHAINGDWDALLRAMRASHLLVHRVDASGMSILHWVCLHQDVPSDVVIKVVFANPHAVQLRNDAGHVPLDLALQAECSDRILDILRAAAASALTIDYDDGDMDNNDHRRQLALASTAHNDEPDEEDSHSVYEQQHSSPRFYQLQQHLTLLDEHNSHPVDTNGFYPQQRVDSYRQYTQDDSEDAYDMNNRVFNRPRGLSAPKPSLQQHQPTVLPPPNGLISIYSNQTIHANDTTRERQRSRSSHNHEYNHSFTDEQLQQREHDLIAYAPQQQPADRLHPPSPALVQRSGPSLSPSDWHKDPRRAATATHKSASSATQQPLKRTTAAFPPRWQQARTCHVCATLFSLLKRRHHCRNCGESVCGAHSTNRVALPKFALVDPQRLCDKCFLTGSFLATGRSSSTLLVPPGAGSFGIDSLGGGTRNYHHSTHHTTTSTNSSYRHGGLYHQQQQPQQQRQYEQQYERQYEQRQQYEQQPQAAFAGQ